MRCGTACISPHDPYFPEPEKTVWQLRLDGETVALMNYSLDRTAPYWAIEVQFERWLEANYPDEATEYDAALTFANDPKSDAELIKRLVELWRADGGE